MLNMFFCSDWEWQQLHWCKKKIKLDQHSYENQSEFTPNPSKNIAKKPTSLSFSLLIPLYSDVFFYRSTDGHRLKEEAGIDYVLSSGACPACLQPFSGVKSLTKLITFLIGPVLHAFPKS